MISASGAYPIDLVKTRLMNQRNLRVYEDSLDCVTKVTRLEGVRGLYRGLSLQVSPSRSSCPHTSSRSPS